MDDKNKPKPAHLKTNLIGQIMVRKCLITTEQLDQALNAQKEKGERLGDTLIKLGFISEESLGIVLASQADLVYIPIEKYNITEETMNLIPRELALKYKIIPLELLDDVLTVSVCDPFDIQAIKELSEKISYKIICTVGAKSMIGSKLQVRDL